MDIIVIGSIEMTVLRNFQLAVSSGAVTYYDDCLIVDK